MTDIVDVRLTVNGQERAGRCETRTLLADFIRESLDLTGTHIGCEHGICGACTILFNGQAARSCTMFAVQANGASITTVEGLASGDTLHPVQQAFHENHGLQCGFCTPGMLMNVVDFLQVNPHPTEEEVRLAISAVLCRCTGYQHVVESVMAAARSLSDAEKVNTEI
jgi:aerobic-type carbon monoxide dehydrogenase small subunit (CoxS/CutS family)